MGNTFDTLHEKAIKRLFDKKDNYDGTCAMSEVAWGSCQILDNIFTAINNGNIICSEEEKKKLLDVIKNSMLTMYIAGLSVPTRAIRNVKRTHKISPKKAMDKIDAIITKAQNELKGKIILNEKILGELTKDITEIIIK